MNTAGMLEAPTRAVGTTQNIVWLDYLHALALKEPSGMAVPVSALPMEHGGDEEKGRAAEEQESSKCYCGCKSRCGSARERRELI